MWLEIVCVLYMTIVVIIFFVFEKGNCLFQWSRFFELKFFFFCEQKKEQLSTQKKSIKINSIEKEFI